MGGLRGRRRGWTPSPPGGGREHGNPHRATGPLAGDRTPCGGARGSCALESLRSIRLYLSGVGKAWPRLTQHGTGVLGWPSRVGQARRVMPEIRRYAFPRKSRYKR